MKDGQKIYSIRKLICVQHFDPDTLEYICDKDIFRYKNIEKREWLNRGDIIKHTDGDFYVYLGYTKPLGSYIDRIRHHLMDRQGKRFLWKLPIDYPIYKVDIDDND